MAALQVDIDSYIASVRYAHSEFVNKQAGRRMLGDKVTFCRDLRCTLLAYYIRMIEDYFDQHDDAGDSYEDYNFFTTAEATDIMQHVNAICETNYFLDIT